VYLVASDERGEAQEVDSDQPGAHLAQVAGRIEASAPLLVEQQMAALRRFHSYRRVPEEDLHRSCERNVVRIVTSLRGHEQLPPGIEEDERASGRRRALQGISSVDVVEAYRAVLGVLRDAFLTEAAHESVPLDAVLLGTRRLWELTDHFSSELVSARHQVDVDLARREVRERLTFLNNVLTGTMELDELMEGGASYGISADHEYFVLRARPGPSSGDAEALIHRLDRATRTPELTPLLGLTAGDVVGICGRYPDSVGIDVLLAVEGPVRMTSLQSAFVEATRLIGIAARYGMSGTVNAGMLSLRAAVVQQDRIGEALYRRFVVTVEVESTISDVILESVRGYLDHRRSTTLAAQALSIHVNTLRYRLQRFEAMTGADLGDTTTSLEVWWALQYALVRLADS